MRSEQTLLTVVVLLAGLALAGAAVTVSASDTNSDDDHDLGICLEGADTPCTDELADDDLATDDYNDSDEVTEGDTVYEENDTITREVLNESDEYSDDTDVDAGICVIGADSPCNAEEYEEEITEEEWDEEYADKPTNDSGDDADAGICLTGVDSPCNDDEWDGDTDEYTAEESAGDGYGTGPGWVDGNDVGICVIGVDSPCNAFPWDMPIDTDSIGSMNSPAELQTSMRSSLASF